MKCKLFEHVHARRSWVTLRCSPDGARQKVLVVETHCGTREACDEAAIADLSKAVVDFIKREAIDEAEIVPFRP